jgi:predicted AAA+ superfamily ATPase
MLHDYVHEIAASGLPGIRPLGPEMRARRLDFYIRTLLVKDLPEWGAALRRPEMLLDWLAAYARAAGTTASHAAILKATSPDCGRSPAKSTAVAYRSAMAALWVSDPVPAWPGAGAGIDGLVKSDKHFLFDTGIAARLMGLTQAMLLRGAGPAPIGPASGGVLERLFEALVASSLQTYAQAIGARLFHLRKHDGSREVDFIVERDRSIVAIDVKLATAIEDDAVRHLNWFATLARGFQVTRLVLHVGQAAYRRPDGIHVVPAAVLGP